MSRQIPRFDTVGVPAGVLKTPFPYPGGKSLVADLVWSRLGNVDNYIEPFAGSLAVLMRRPARHFEASTLRRETMNDTNHFIVNFFRSVKADPDEVAKWCDEPVHEADLHARHKWLMRSTRAKEFKERMTTDPEAFDAKIAGWWAWGMCAWIGGAWCVESRIDGNSQPQIDVMKGVNGRPQLADARDVGRGVNASAEVGNLQIPDLSGGFGRGTGVNGVGDSSDRTGRGVTAGPWDGTCESRRAWLQGWMRRLADRLRLVRTCYGHWSRICDSDSTLTRLGTCGVFLDPPYPAKRVDGTKSRDDGLYANDKTQDLNALRDEVLAWCRKWGGDRKKSVVVCGYEGDGYEALGWEEVAWESQGGYSNQRRKGKGKGANAKRERLWFSPACESQPSLFDRVEEIA